MERRSHRRLIALAAPRGSTAASRRSLAVFPMALSLSLSAVVIVALSAFAALDALERVCARALAGGP